MEEKDFLRIEKILEQRDKGLRDELSGIGLKVGTIGEKVADMEQKVEAIGEKATDMEQRFETLSQEIKTLRQDINGDFKHHLGIFTEDIHTKLQLVAEGHQMLSEKLDRVEDGLEKKIDAVAADLTAHRTDTEAHKRGYMVREPE